MNRDKQRSSSERKMLPMVSGSVRRWLRWEGAAALALSAMLYWREGASWWVFGACFLLPDVTMLGYLGGRRLGASLYNAGHSYLGPVLLAVFSFGLSPDGIAAALIWASHIGFDRTLGYGLKYPTAFGDTHLGRLGPQTKGSAGSSTRTLTMDDQGLL